MALNGFAGITFVDVSVRNRGEATPFLCHHYINHCELCTKFPNSCLTETVII